MISGFTGKDYNIKSVSEFTVNIKMLFNILFSILSIYKFPLLKFIL